MTVPTVSTMLPPRGRPPFQPRRRRDRGEEDRGARNIQHVLFINEHQEGDNSRTHTNTHPLSHTQTRTQTHTYLPHLTRLLIWFGRAIKDSSSKLRGLLTQVAPHFSLSWLTQITFRSSARPNSLTQNSITLFFIFSNASSLPPSIWGC